MILQSIGVRRFRAIRDRTINFSAGLNIIKGSDNEAGKSSLRMAIVKALYQDPTTSRAKVQGLTSWGVEEPWEIVLEFQADSESYRMVKSLKDGVCQLTEIGPSRVLTSKNAIAAKVAQITGCPSETFFESTACVG
ncbi:MAG: AAA family ATPase, partial [Dehalococcoidia bacterium]|nr:AAA family ATPase [Dehalococcoidia bacterium]